MAFIIDAPETFQSSGRAIDCLIHDPAVNVRELFNTLLLTPDGRCRGLGPISFPVIEIVAYHADLTVVFSNPSYVILPWPYSVVRPRSEAESCSMSILELRVAAA